MEKVNVKISPRGQLEVLSQREVSSLLDSSQTGLYSLYRNCSLAVLNSGADVDDTEAFWMLTQILKLSFSKRIEGYA